MRHWRILVTLVVVVSFVFIDSAVAACHIAAFEASAYNTGESAGIVTVKVELQGGTSSCSGTVHYKTQNGSAAGGQDFDHREGDVAFTANDDREESIQIPIREDSAVEGDETFSVELSNPTGTLGPGTGSPTTVVIQDNDQAAPPPPPPPPPPPKPSPSPAASPGVPVAVPSPSPSPTLSPSPSPTTLAKAKESEGFPVVAIIAIAALLVAAGAGGLLYWVRKRPT